MCVAINLAGPVDWQRITGAPCAVTHRGLRSTYLNSARHYRTPSILTTSMLETRASVRRPASASAGLKAAAALQIL